MFTNKLYNSSSKSASSLLAAVYGWMAVALTLSSLTAYATVASPSLFAFIHTNPLLFFGLFIVQIGVVITLSAALPKLSFPAALGLFLVYAATVGLTLSSILVMYTAVSLGTTFLTTAGMFGTMALYGHYTDADLSGIGSICFMLLIGLILGMIINIFLQNEVFDLVMSAVGVVVFTLFIAYDTQKIKLFMQQQLTDQAMAEKITILAALMLYLDFVNLFIYLLRFLGKRREN